MLVVYCWYGEMLCRGETRRTGGKGQEEGVGRPQEWRNVVVQCVLATGLLQENGTNICGMYG